VSGMPRCIKIAIGKLTVQVQRQIYTLFTPTLRLYDNDCLRRAVRGWGLITP
jgi:hypothetical protein